MADERQQKTANEPLSSFELEEVWESWTNDDPKRLLDLTESDSESKIAQ